jgi:rhodanese-related sulfurtransferase
MIKECTVKDLDSKLKGQEKIQFIDCRENEEWNEAHILGVELLPLSQFETKYEAILKDKNASIIIHCRSGKRSMNACMFLLSKGYTDLTNVEGGIMAWIQEGLPTISE